MGERATVEFRPQDEGEFVILKPCWVADNGWETCVFPTKDEAIAFCWRRWRVRPDEIRVTEPRAGSREGKR